MGHLEARGNLVGKRPPLLGVYTGGMKSSGGVVSTGDVQIMEDYPPPSLCSPSTRFY